MGFSYLDIYNKRVEENEIRSKTALAEQAEYDTYNRKISAVRESADIAKANRGKAYSEFKRSVSESYVSNFLWAIYETVLEKNMASDFAKSIGLSTLESYIWENGADNIVKSMNGKTLFLSEAAKLLDDYITEAIDEADPSNTDTYAIDPEQEQEFFDNLSRSDEIEDIANSIRMKVVDAEEKMATDNIQDKIDMDDIMRSAAQRIESIKQSNSEDEISDDSADTQQQEAVMISKAKMNAVTTKRPRSVLEQMIRSTSKKVLKDNVLSEVYCEDGKINFDKLVEANTAIYTFMEMLNTMQLEDYTPEMIKQIVS